MRDDDRWSPRMASVRQQQVAVAAAAAEDHTDGRQADVDAAAASDMHAAAPVRSGA